ncbi:unnamed protein product [Caenorhabditis bovis]|uniref:Serine aminopeptidase S33 domain-containing protein n=1 Tax=Caenorhabditis bovis TaxID=2654633 RepID=A0A8S1FGB7_9PELO|nr:unnamed protein product [Caenorhabditis bovis]
MLWSALHEPAIFADYENDYDGPLHDNRAPGCCDVLFGVLRACGMVCYIACPPMPSHITRKLAFHPPPKGLTYHIELKSQPERILKNIAEAKGQEIQLIIRNLSTQMDYIPDAKSVEVFSVETSQHNHLVCVRCIPYEPSTCSTLADQVILFCQPNSSDIGGFLQPHIMNLTNYANIFEMDVYAFDYSGYGYSSGREGEKNVYADVRAVYQHIRRAQPNKKIVLMGYSIGTTAAIDLACTNPEGLSGVVLVAPFTSGLRLVSSKPAKPETCWADSFKSYDKIGSIDAKVLICHGDMDEVVPLSHGLALYEKLKNPVPPSVVHGANHHTVLSGRHSQTFSRILRFLKNETDVKTRTTEISSRSDNNASFKST